MRIGRRARWEVAAGAYWAGYGALQLWYALASRVDFYDAFVYLRNARRLAGADVGYVTYRLPGLPLAHAPLQTALDALHASPVVRLAASHALQAALSTACIVAVYRLLRARLPREWAHAGAILFSLNRLVVHYFTASLTDLPCALALAVFFLYEGKKPSPRTTLAAAAALGACLLLRWNMLALPFLALACRWIETAWGEGAGGAGDTGTSLPFHRALAPAYRAILTRETASLLAAGALASLAFAAVNVAVYRRLFHLPLGEAWAVLERSFWGQLSSNSAPEPWRVAASGLAASSGLACAAACVAGWLRCVSKRIELRAASFLVMFLGMMTFGVGHKETRYLMPALPFFYLFAAVGMKEAWERAGARRAALGRPALGAGVVALLAGGAVVEGYRLFDPALRQPVVLDTARNASQAAGPEGRIFWQGFAYSHVPRDGLFVAGDLHYYLYHVPSVESTEFFLGRRLPSASRREELRTGDAVVVAPRRLYTAETALQPGENRVRIYTVGPKGYFRLFASFGRDPV